MVYMAGRGVNYEPGGQIMKAFVGAAKDLGHSPISKGWASCGLYVDKWLGCTGVF